MTLVTLLLTLIVFLLFPRVERQRDEMFEDEIAEPRLFAPSDLGRRSRPGTAGPRRRAADPVFRRAGPRAAPTDGRTAAARFGGHQLCARPLAQPRETRARSRATHPLKPLAGRIITCASKSRSSRSTSSTLFAVFPVFPVGASADDDGIEINRSRRRTTPARTLPMAALRIQLGTLAIQNRRQVPLVPRRRLHAKSSSPKSCCRCRRLRPAVPIRSRACERSPTRCAEQAQLDPEQHFEIAKALASYLRDSGQFEYSDVGQKRTAGVDPLGGFRHRASPRPLRILRRRAGTDASQPRHSRPRGHRLPGRRMELGRRLLSCPPVARPRLGRSLARTGAARGLESLPHGPGFEDWSRGAG